MRLDFRRLRKMGKEHEILIDSDNEFQRTGPRIDKDFFLVLVLEKNRKQIIIIIISSKEIIIIVVMYNEELRVKSCYVTYFIVCISHDDEITT